MVSNVDVATVVVFVLGTSVDLVPALFVPSTLQNWFQMADVNEQWWSVYWTPVSFVPLTLLQNS